jgi:Fic-DOC domain mobile mystery protein B
MAGALTAFSDDEPEGATPLTPEGREGLIPSGVSLRHELNEYEQANITEARLWGPGRKHNPVEVPFCRNLHRRMFGTVWKWVGVYRAHNTYPVGCDHPHIEQQLYQMIGITAFWIENQTFAADEIAVRFHHGLVKIHPFANGNGRWSRLMGDVLARYLDRPVFTWGGSQLLGDDDVRRAYLASLRKADGDDFPDLLTFARS